MSAKIRIADSIRNGHSLGRGVFAEERISKGTSILPINGGTLQLEEVRTMGELESYPLQIGVREFINPEPPMRIINHSCEPNCYIRDREVVALRDIDVGEELGYDYSLTIGQPGWCMRCRCATPSCRKIVTCFMHLAPEVRIAAMNAGHVPRFLLKVAIQEEKFRGWTIEELDFPAREDWWKRPVELELMRERRIRTSWNESKAFRLQQRHVDEIEAAALEIAEMTRVGLDLLLEEGFPLELSISPTVLTSLTNSLTKREEAVVTRITFDFDLLGRPFVHEIVGDAPINLLEAGMLQWNWLQYAVPSAVQINEIEECITASFKRFAGRSDALHITCTKEDEHDRQTARYLASLAEDAGLKARRVYLEDIGWNAEAERFVDHDEKEIALPYFIYPWRYLIEEPFGETFLISSSSEQALEPFWTSVLRQPHFLPTLRALFPAHPYLRTALAGEVSATAYLSDGKFAGLIFTKNRGSRNESIHPHFFQK